MENGNIPATKADLAELGQELRTGLTELRTELTSLEARLNERHEIPALGDGARLPRPKRVHAGHRATKSILQLRRKQLQNVWSSSRGMKRR